MMEWDTSREAHRRLAVPAHEGRADAMAWRMRSSRRTHLSVRPALSDAPGSPDVFGVPFSVEWEGWHELFFTRAHFGLPTDAPWPAFTSAALVALDYGRAGTVLTLEPPRWVPEIPPPCRQ